jgi:hypothetical protein
MAPQMNVAVEKYRTFSETEWRDLAQNHFDIAPTFTAGPRLRRDRDEKHPVEDFLFNYYPYPIALLELWQPGIGVALRFHDVEALPSRFLGKRYRTDGGVCWLDRDSISEKERQRLSWIHSLLTATQSHVPNFACHGLHEWAMVYRAEEIRHSSLAPLRLPQREIDSLVESRSITCTHHDAFRFFSKQALPLNRIQPTLDTRHENEQPGCIHANMDLYKWAAKSMPWIGSDLLLEIFRLATRLRDLDMRASPYDLAEWNVTPVKIETPEGRREYEAEQRKLADESRILRNKLIHSLDDLLVE